MHSKTSLFCVKKYSWLSTGRYCVYKCYRSCCQSFNLFSCTRSCSAGPAVAELLPPVDHLPELHPPVGGPDLPRQVPPPRPADRQGDTITLNMNVAPKLVALAKYR